MMMQGFKCAAFALGVAGPSGAALLEAFSPAPGEPIGVCKIMKHSLALADFGSTCRSAYASQPQCDGSCSRTGVWIMRCRHLSNLIII